VVIRWDPIINLRKLFCVAAVVFLANYGVAAQMAGVAMIVNLALILHLIAMPYKVWQRNRAAACQAGLKAMIT
jgi:hypothetical protein